MKSDKVYKYNKNHIRVLSVNLTDYNKLTKLWLYEIKYITKDVEDVKTEIVIGQDVTDALYRFEQLTKTFEVSPKGKRLLLG
jgi:hypothetical protein